MEAILQSLHEVEGVQATLVMDAGGQLLAHRAHAVYDRGLLEEVGRTVVNAVDSLQLVHDDWELVSAGFSEGKLLLRNLGSSRQAGRAAVLAVVADARLNVSFAGVAIRVAASRLRSAASTAAAPSIIPLPVSPPPLAIVPPPTSAPVPTATSSGDPRAAAFLAACTEALAGSVGPMAKVFVKEGLRSLCGGATAFGREHALALVGHLEKHIDDPAERAQFRKTMIPA
jgi:predicted regulator of Ras-like GTPase activity (Roadblock/LC7/MglB family)